MRVIVYKITCRHTGEQINCNDSVALYLMNGLSKNQLKDKKYY